MIIMIIMINDNNDNNDDNDNYKKNDNNIFVQCIINTYLFLFLIFFFI